MAVAKFWWSTPSNVALAYSSSWRDGLSATGAMNVFGPILWTSRASLSPELTSYLLRESASTNAVIAFGGTGNLSATTLGSAGASVAANAAQVAYTPFRNGDAPASSRTSALRTGGDENRNATTARTGPVGADPHLESLRTVQHQ